MRYAQIRSMDISNGEGVGVSLFVQGCYFHCKDCFNSETWDFNGGEEWTDGVKKNFIKFVNRPYIKRVSILGGEPLADKNLNIVLSLVSEIRIKFPSKIIWLYTGYTWEDIWMDSNIIFDKETMKVYEDYKKRQQIISQCDIIIDGHFEADKKDLSLKWRGSSNQRVIDVKKSITQDKIVLYCD